MAPAMLRLMGAFFPVLAFFVRRLVSAIMGWDPVRTRAAASGPSPAPMPGGTTEADGVISNRRFDAEIEVLTTTDAR